MKSVATCLVFTLIAFGDQVIAQDEEVILPMNQPKKNVWETLAKASGLDTICLMHSRPNKPFTTCLVGLPVSKWPIPDDILPQCSQLISNPVDGWEIWTKFLPVAHQEPQELEILGSTIMTFCIEFNSPKPATSKGKITDVTPNKLIYRNATSWCNHTRVLNKPSNQVPMQLPKGNFLICGDRVWPAIPANVKGGPCTIGRLSLLTPNMTSIKEHKHKEKRSLQQYDDKCDDDVHTWDTARTLIVSLLAPQVSSGIALSQLAHLGCWLSKYAQDISLAVSDLMTDIDGVRQASLQNRAAIDYLLLLHGHGCQEFEGMCCMNLSDHSKSIHEHIKQLEQGISKIGMETGSWLDDMFNFLDPSPLWKGFLKIGIYVLCSIVVLFVFIPCLLQRMRRYTSKAVKEVLLVQTEGGDQSVTDCEQSIEIPHYLRTSPQLGVRSPKIERGMSLVPTNNLFPSCLLAPYHQIINFVTELF